MPKKSSILQWLIMPCLIVLVIFSYNSCSDLYSSVKNLKEIFALKFDANGGEGSTDSIKAAQDSIISLPENGFTRVGYNFLGWNTKKDGTDKRYAEKEKYTVLGNTTFYASWSTDGYSITYNLNGGINHADNPVSYTIESGAINLAPPSKSGYVFVGWYDNADFAGTAVNSIPENSTGNKTFWAKWSTDGYSITYNLNGGINHANNPASYTIETATINLQNPSKTGYTFGGWYDNTGLTGTAITQIVEGSTGTKTFWAKWSTDGYSITYNLNGGTNHTENPASYTVESGEINLQNPSKTGYTFGGWYDNTDFAGTAINAIPENSTDDKTFWAKWTAISYNIIYNLDGGENNSANPINYTIETATITLEEPIKDTYMFMGWYDNASFLDDPITHITSGSTGNKEFYASFSDIEYTAFALVPGGTFTQTSTASGNPSFSHTVDSFQMAKYQVTYELWYTVRIWAESTDRGVNKYSFANKGMEGSVTGGGSSPNNYTNIGKAPTIAKLEPVTTVNWRDCIIWCNAYSEMSGLNPCYTYNGQVLRTSTNTSGTATDADQAECNWTANGYRLPTEGEWQYTASNKGATAYNWASGASADYANLAKTNEVAWYWVSTDYPSGTKKTQPVGGKKNNTLGIYDMSGNVYEWCWDWNVSYPSTAQTNYRDVASSSYRVLRGGGWRSNADDLQVGCRYSEVPIFVYDSVGFRLARTAN